ncbi:hypothetical protein TL16_g02552 [Triparma laevis f. inornata]|uniref:Uncharacterized protein n=1 Tax=Triparma laevis f. inornata TaxID=1714386 RepID=A0A9W6ZYH9_9STRA|nr:hypothetical protein TL16_g02552 [Triparma laevis f. inornata]
MEQQSTVKLRAYALMGAKSSITKWDSAEEGAEVSNSISKTKTIKDQENEHGYFKGSILASYQCILNVGLELGVIGVRTAREIEAQIYKLTDFETVLTTTQFKSILDKIPSQAESDSYDGITYNGSDKWEIKVPSGEQGVATTKYQFFKEVLTIQEQQHIMCFHKSLYEKASEVISAKYFKNVGEYTHQDDTIVVYKNTVESPSSALYQCRETKFCTSGLFDWRYWFGFWTGKWGYWNLINPMCLGFDFALYKLRYWASVVVINAGWAFILGVGSIFLWTYTILPNGKLVADIVGKARIGNPKNDDPLQGIIDPFDMLQNSYNKVVVGHQSKAIQRLVNSTLANTLNAWIAFVKQTKHERMVVMRFVSKMKHRHVAMCMATWAEFCDKRNFLRRILRRLFGGRSAKLMHGAFDIWREGIKEQDKNAAIIRKFALRMKNQHLTSIFLRWFAFAHEQRENRIIVTRFVKRMQNQSAFRCFRHWIHFSNQRIRIRRLMKKCLGGKRTILLNAALQKWARTVAQEGVSQRENELFAQIEEMQKKIEDYEDEEIRAENEELKERVKSLEESSVVINKLTSLLMSPAIVGAAGAGTGTGIGGRASVAFSPRTNFGEMKEDASSPSMMSTPGKLSLWGADVGHPTPKSGPSTAEPKPKKGNFYTEP